MTVLSSLFFVCEEEKMRIGKEKGEGEGEGGEERE